MSELLPRPSHATNVRTGTCQALLMVLSLLLAACSFECDERVSPEDAVPATQVEPITRDNAFADHDPHAWDYLLEPPDFSQMDVVAVPAAEPDKPDPVQPAESGTKD